ncbi:tetratricopeptide repeat protein 14 [Cricetulus griseus]|uniref:Tetratricopeptide repeat protein 14 n=1 Tax=Cricetulus griseus TaxID=10029 RepID=A0A061IJN7_CRIGR|nr:tetratricopeptide repeat protein 14 [Cricetulus griseus]
MRRVYEMLLMKCSPVTAEDHHILEMTVPQDDHQEQQQPWIRAIKSLETVHPAESGAIEVTQALWKSPEDGLRNLLFFECNLL